MSEECSYGKCANQPNDRHESWCRNICKNEWHAAQLSELQCIRERISDEALLRLERRLYYAKPELFINIIREHFTDTSETRKP